MEIIEFLIIKRYLENILFGQKHLLKKINKMALDLTKLQDALTAETSADTAIINLLTTVKTELDAALANAASTGDLAAIQAVADQLGANTTAIANAITANTPAA